MDESYLEWLDAAAGLGPEKARGIAARFPTFEHLRHATREELTSVRAPASAGVEPLVALSRGAPRASGETRCGICGRAYTKEEAAILPGLESFVRETAPLCPHCGAYLPDGATDCTICGRAPAAPQEAAGSAHNSHGITRGF